MKRLREQLDSSDANEAFGAALLARIGPLQPSAVQKNRLRFALQRSVAMTARRRHRPGLVLGVLMSATGASAMVVHFMRPAMDAPPAAVEVAPAAEHGARGPAARVKVAATTGETPVAPSPPSMSIPDPPMLDRAASPPEGLHKADRSPAGPKQTRTKVRPPIVGLPDDPMRSGPGAGLVIAAMEARRSGDLNRAADLLSEYQRKYPDGPLQEEALALSIEAAVSRGSDAAPGLAAQYLARYPKGRFREQARRALKSILR
ncbi:MAG TPA: hypothetical protein VK540_25470 [Polyangiaceae bacterium]|nr:hypothetical protein [Polyangiaceae bacterium]